ncbi:MAG: dihydroorotase [Kiritimatiellae bacterium]|nr:dihydroorotase [Kiritimatiellia bacterium]
MDRKDCWYIRGARVLDPHARRDETADLYINAGRIAPLPPAPPRGAGLIEADGLVAAPGFIDLHVHLREPGGERAETVETGTRAAARGGFTRVVAMPNTNPPLDSPDRIEWLLRTAAQHPQAAVLPAGCITRGRQGRALADLPALARAGCVAFTDDGATVPDPALMREAMRIAARLQLPVMDHALDARLAGDGVMHDGPRAARLGLPGIPANAEAAIVERDIRLAQETGARVHIQHVSAEEAVRHIRAARAAGLPVSGELTPHHLALTDAAVSPGDTNAKMNPPLRTQRDREALVAAVLDGTLDTFATDHAPHPAEEKGKGFAAAPFGVVGLETAIGVTYTELVHSRLMPLADWVIRWTTGPARVLGLPPPSLEPGQTADLVLLDLDSSWRVDPAVFLSKSRNTPFAGRRLVGRAVCTLRNGCLSWDGRTRM